MNATVAKTSYNRNKIHPQKFALWVACAGITMMFVALTSAYLVRRAAGNWIEFALPDIFTWSTLVIILSSITLYGASRSFKKGNIQLYKGLLISTFILGLAFVSVQYQGWLALKDLLGLPLGTNPSSDFVYAISMIHVAHVMGGIGVLTVALVHGFSLPSKVTPTRLLRLELTSTYWHYVGVLWVYLFVFLAFLT